MRKNIFNPVVTAFSLLALSAGLALGQSQTNETLRVLEVKASDALKKQYETDVKAAKLTGVLDGIEKNVCEGIDDTHKFTVLSRFLKSAGGEQALSGDYTLLAAKYVLDTTVTEFEYDRTDVPISETGQVAAQCTIRLSGKAEFKKPNGLTANANFEVSTNFSEMINPKNVRSKKVGDDLLRAAAREAANQIVRKVVSK